MDETAAIVYTAPVDPSEVDDLASTFEALMDGSDPVEIGTVPFVGCAYYYECGLTWSPDGSSIGFAKDKGDNSAIPADGSSAPEPIDDLTYLNWAGGRFGSH